MISLKDQTVLVIAPHPDDEVFGCGGLIHRIKQEGGKVYVLYLTCGATKDFSQKGISTKEERMNELKKVAKFLEFDGWRIAFPGNEYHLRIDMVPKKDLINEIERGKSISLEAIQPTMVLTPSFFDYNQDHRAANEAVIAATRPTPPGFKQLQRIVLTYELPYGEWSSIEAISAPSFFVSLGLEDLEAKMKAVKLYKSQIKNNKSPLSPYGVQAMAAMRGLQCGMDMAEAYFPKRVLV
jgi:N-acetylglucosamine malate deacetylase 1